MNQISESDSMGDNLQGILKSDYRGFAIKYAESVARRLASITAKIVEEGRGYSMYSLLQAAKTIYPAAVHVHAPRTDDGYTWHGGLEFGPTLTLHDRQEDGKIAVLFPWSVDAEREIQVYSDKLLDPNAVQAFCGKFADAISRTIGLRDKQKI